MDSFISKIFGSKNNSKSTCIYVAETNNLSARLTLHFNGSVNSSPLRELIALRMGFDIVKRMEGVGHRIIKKIESSRYGDAEQLISEYIQSGFWKFTLFSSLEESKDFFWYACEKLKPAFITHIQSWDLKERDLYKHWFERLENSEKIDYQNLSKLTTKSAICTYFNELLPEQYLNQNLISR